MSHAGPTAYLFSLREKKSYWLEWISSGSELIQYKNTAICQFVTINIKIKKRPLKNDPAFKKVDFEIQISIMKLKF